ncbi:TetR/AcrR family transcriptional regulator [Halomonas nitroreducens]|uniref:TetR family transcriptional regulator n=1 Tax=Halomonas nitroreducens TaxID=447425 RepID=A0A3S0I9U4_9GAMM|nr:TetR family transcriptional regulator [Halomonas nitroreducens]RTR06318.1 TetR family transcriptional regulator [Halomonas nitroreducens]
MSERQHLSAKERRERTVETVVTLCSEEEPATLTTGRIAQRMGVTQGALFRHFPNKDAIWAAVVAWVTDQVMARVGAAAEAAEDPLAALEAMFLAHVAFIAEHPGVPRLLMAQLQHPRPTIASRMVRGLMKRYQRRLLGLLEEARRQGRLRPGLDLDAAATQFIGCLQGLVMQSLIADDVASIGERAPAAFELYRHGIRTTVGGDA